MPPFYKNGFVVSCEETGDAVVIDPGDEVHDLIAAVRNAGVNVRQILLTHAHLDHITGVGRAKAAFEVPVWLHRDDLFLYEASSSRARCLALVASPQPPVDQFYDPGYAVSRLAGTSSTSCRRRGTVPAASAWRSEDGQPARELFVGDTLFAGSIGRTDLPGGSYNVLMRSIREVSVGVSRRHRRAPRPRADTTIGEERRTNPFL